MPSHSPLDLTFGSLWHRRSGASRVYRVGGPGSGFPDSKGGKVMANLKSIITFWTTFPGVLTGAAVIMVGTGVVIWMSIAGSGPEDSRSCTEYQRGHEDQVACNSATHPGYYWALGVKREHYSAGGVSPVGSEPQCGRKTVGRWAMSARFPLRDAAFLPVRDSYRNEHSDLVAPGCNLSDAGEKMTDRDLGAICGLFTFECKKQPR